MHLPFMILPLYTNLEKHDPALLDAAQDLGANAWQRFWRVTFPLSLPGIFSGSALVFIPVLGMFAIPEILGGTGRLAGRQHDQGVSSSAPATGRSARCCRSC
ncbi:MAG: ABC transporter permease subunit [Chromatiales bacterium]|nr:ABC transporter permease subunit [Chromatiales bacterium]